MERWTLSLRGFRRAAIITTIGVAVLVVAGGVVRLTGSGLGCEDWPSCSSERFVDVSSGHTAIEQLNRLLSGLIAIPTLIMAVGAFRVRPQRRGLVGPSLGVLATILGNAVVGGLAVRGDLHPALVQSHFLLAMAAITFGMVAIERADPGRRDDERGSVSALPIPVAVALWATVVLTAAAVVTGTVVTGTGPHAGDEDVRRWGFDISDVARLHSVTVLLAMAAFLALVWVVHRDADRWAQMTSAFSTWLFLGVVQGAIGYVQYFAGVPELLVGAHLAGATALWAATVHLVQVAGRQRAGSHRVFARVSVPA
jgi:cytochrome c oxidase assembly protein subunit 15